MRRVKRTRCVGVYGAVLSGGFLLVGTSGCMPSLPAERFSVVPDRVPYEEFVTRITSPTGLAFDRFGRFLVASAAMNGCIWQFAVTGERLKLVAGLQRPMHLAVEQGGDVYVSVATPQGNIFRIAPDGSRVIRLRGIQNPVGLATDNFGRLYIAESVPRGRILRYADDELLTWAEDLNRPTGLATDDSGNVFVLESTGRLLRMRFNGARHPVVPAGLLRQPQEILYSPAFAGIFVTENVSRGRLCFIDIEDGAVTSLLYDLRRPHGLALDAEGNLYIAESDRKRVLRIRAEDLKEALMPPDK